MAPNDKLKPLLDNAPYVAEVERSNNKAIIFSVVITAIVFSALTFFWQNFNQKNKNEEISLLSSQVTTLSSQLAVLQADLLAKVGDEQINPDNSNFDQKVVANVNDLGSYKNSTWGYFLNYPKSFDFEKGVNIMVYDELSKDEPNSVYLDHESEGTKIFGGQSWYYYTFPNGICDHGGCLPKALVFKTYKNNLRYIITFFNTTKVTSDIQTMLDTWKF